ncbi:MAG: hypothetical protein PHO33_00600 [Clostridia bacterium]|nr:hypothetical protein [Clostridia bacterium]
MYICIFLFIVVLFMFFILKHNLSACKNLCKIIEESLCNKHSTQSVIDNKVILPFKFSTYFLLKFIKKTAQNLKTNDKYYKHIFVQNIKNILIATYKINTKKIYYIAHYMGVPVIFLNFINNIENSEFSIEELRCINDMFAYYNLFTLYTVLKSKNIFSGVLNYKVEQCINAIIKFAVGQKLVFYKKYLKPTTKLSFDYLFKITNQKATLLISNNFNAFFDYCGCNFFTFKGKHFCESNLKKSSLNISINGEQILQNSLFLGGQNLCTFFKKHTDFITFISICSPPNFDGLLCKVFTECKSSINTNFVVTSEWNLPQHLKKYSVIRKNNKHALVIKDIDSFTEYKVMSLCEKYSVYFDSELGTFQNVNGSLKIGKNLEIYFTLKVQNNSSFVNLSILELEYCFTSSNAYYYEFLAQNRNKFTDVYINNFAYKLLNNYTDFSTHSLIKYGKLKLQILDDCDINYKLPIVKCEVLNTTDLIVFNKNLNELLFFNSLGIYYNLVVLYNNENLKKYFSLLTRLKPQKYVIKPKIICISFAKQKYIGSINLLDINNAVPIYKSNENLFNGLKIIGNVEYTINEYLDIIKNIKYYSAYIKNSHNAETNCEVSFYENIEQEFNICTKFYKEKKNNRFLFYDFTENVLYCITYSNKFVDNSLKTCPEIALKAIFTLPAQSTVNIIFTTERLAGFFELYKFKNLLIETDISKNLNLPVILNCNNKNLCLLINSMLFENAQKICAKSFFSHEYLKNYFNVLKFFTFNKCRELEEIFIFYMQKLNAQSEYLNEFLETLLIYCINSGDNEFNSRVKDFCCNNANASNLYLVKLCNIAFYGSVASTSVVHNLDTRLKSTNLENTIKKIYGLSVNFSLSVSECFQIYEYFLECVFGIKVLHGKAYLTMPQLNMNAQLKLEINGNKLSINYIKKQFNTACRLISGGVEYSINNLPITAFKDIDFIL